MIYTAIDTFYLTDEQLKNSPSREDGIDEEIETTLRIYGCDLIQESGILLRLPQVVMATGQVLFHRFYCKTSFARFDVKIVAASCIWLASKLEESPIRARQVLIVFHRMERRRENLPMEHLDLCSKKFIELKTDLVRAERHLLKEMGFICHAEHPHKFLSNYLAALGTPPELRQDAWNMANDSLRTTLCVRFKSEVIACGVVYAAARRFGVPLPENPPWWKLFDANKSEIDQVCRVLAHLYSRPKAKYIPVCKERVPESWDLQSQSVPKESSLITPAYGNDPSATKMGFGATANVELGRSKEALVKLAPDNLKEAKRSPDTSTQISLQGRSPNIPAASDITGATRTASGAANAGKSKDAVAKQALDKLTKARTSSVTQTRKHRPAYRIDLTPHTWKMSRPCDDRYDPQVKAELDSSLGTFLTTS